MTLKETLFKLDLLISHPFSFKYLTPQIILMQPPWFLGLKENFAELKSDNKSFFGMFLRNYCGLDSV